MTAKIICIAGARPNFMKIAPILRAIQRCPSLETRLVHTGQHYDARLSQVFFEELAIPRPDYELAVGSGSHATQTAEIIRKFEPVLEQEQPHAVLVVGDVNSTIACAMVTAKFRRRTSFACTLGRRNVPLLVHVEAGLRSFDPEMPEEINRKLTDAISDVLLVSEMSGVTNLIREGVAEDRIHLVGNVMIDSLHAAKASAEQSKILHQLGLKDQQYALVTLHRPSNVDDPTVLEGLLKTLDALGDSLPLLFPVHPRTRERLTALQHLLKPERWIFCDPLGYVDFLKVMSSAKLVLTDSGGVQEETTALGIPCLTLRDNTERPSTISHGTNTLVGTDGAAIKAAFLTAVASAPSPRIPDLWDGRAAERIAAILERAFYTE
jgi:UDP-N-acetylglucosamine 2-epimerase (non-hydrolysing)